MPEARLEELVEERQFAGLLQTHAEAFFRIANTLTGLATTDWSKKHYFQLINESDALESFLDDYGARYNRTYAFLTELVASLRWFAYSGYSVSHMLGRLESYGASLWDADESDEALVEIRDALGFVGETAEKLLKAVIAEAQALGVEITPEGFSEPAFVPVPARRRLPRNVGQAELVDEGQKIAEVASKFLQAAEMVSETGVRRIADAEERHRLFARVSTEELARVYEATVHNLQSTYDTHVQNTVLERDDPRLAQLRGHTSVALHLLQAVTYLAHFIERHENEVRSEDAKSRISKLIARDDVERVTFNAFLYWAHRVLQNGVALAEDLLPEYTNLTELDVRLADGFLLHARPAALIVGVVNHHGTPVEMELAGKRCNAASILELLVTVGSHPNEREFVFRGDERPLRHIQLLFEADFGENGLDELPDELDYLRQS